VRCICSWCNTEMKVRPGDAGDDSDVVSHGICIACIEHSELVPVERLSSLTEAMADRLPYGVIELNKTGHVQLYNAAESRLASRAKSQVMNRHFFTEVAPCARLKELEIQFGELVRNGVTDRRELDFLFTFESGAVYVHIVLCHDALTKKTTLLIRPIRD
jgi:photoactive yellow protein